jgi:phage tail-like protein
MPLYEDPAGSHYFALEIDGVEIAHFRECSGIKTTAAIFELQEGGVNDRVHRFVGESTWDNVVLKFATQTSRAMHAWRERCRDGDHASRSGGAITLYGVDGEVVERFDLKDVWPVRWAGPALGSGDSAIAVEELEIAHGGVQVS